MKTLLTNEIVKLSAYHRSELSIYSTLLLILVNDVCLFLISHWTLHQTVISCANSDCETFFLMVTSHARVLFLFFVFAMKLTRKWFQITERVYSTKFWVRYLVILLHYGVNSIAETSTCELRAVFFTLHWKTQMYLQLTYIYQNISKKFELSTYRACNCGIVLNMVDH